MRRPVLRAKYRPMFRSATVVFLVFAGFVAYVALRNTWLLETRYYYVITDLALESLVSLALAIITVRLPKWEDVPKLSRPISPG